MNPQSNAAVKFKPWQIVAALFVFAVAIRFSTTMLYISYLDMYMNVDWAKGAAADLFRAYSNVETMDYPPLYIIMLTPIGWLYNNFPVLAEFDPYVLMLIKSVSILFDSLCVVLIYQIAKKYSKELALVGAALWAIHPAFFINSAFWGQTDAILAFILLLSFSRLEKGRPVWGTVIYALAVMTKHQAIYFGPIVLLELLMHYKPKKILQSIGAAGGVYFAVYLPFMIGLKAPLFFINVYTRAFGMYDFISIEAFNIYGIFGLSFKPDTTPILGGFNFTHLGFVFLGLSLGFLVFMYIKAKRFSPWVGGFLFLQCVFMLTTRMHERYQIIVLPFLLMAWLSTRRRDFFWLFTSISLISACNHFLAIMGYRYADVLPDARAFSLMGRGFSLVNLAVFVWSIVAVVKYAFEADAPAGDGSTVSQNRKELFPT